MQHVVAVDPDGTLETHGVSALLAPIVSSDLTTELTSFQLVGDVESPRDVLGKDSRGETVLGIVGSLENLLLGLELDQDDDGSEDFLMTDLHRFVDISKDGRLDIVTLVTESLSSEKQVGTVVFTRLDVTHDPVVLNLTDLGTLESIGLEGVANLESLGVFKELLLELVVDALLDKDPVTMARLKSVRMASE